MPCYLAWQQQYVLLSNYFVLLLQTLVAVPVVHPCLNTCLAQVDLQFAMHISFTTDSSVIHCRWSAAPAAVTEADALQSAAPCNHNEMESTQGRGSAAACHADEVGSS